MLVWLAATPPSIEQRAEIVEWAAQRGFHTLPPAPFARPTYPAAAAREIERLLEDARAASSAEVFTRLDALLEAHPELPQAAWLLAERHALEAQHARRLGSNATAPDGSAGDVRAAELEGPRARAYGLPGPPRRSPSEPPLGGLPLSSLRAADRVFIDGVVAPPEPHLTGRHHVRVHRGGVSVLSRWVDLPLPEGAELAPPAPPCSELDLLGTGASAAGPAPLPGVACGEWAVARPAGSGVELALCAGAACGSWERQPGSAPKVTRSSPEGDGDLAPGSRWPTWATWAAVGSGVLLVTGVVLWRAGAFEGARPAPEFVFTGPSAAALRF